MNMRLYILNYSFWLRVAGLLIIILPVMEQYSQGQVRPREKGDLYKIIYPVNVSGWIDFVSGNNANPEFLFEEYKQDFKLSVNDKMLLYWKQTDDLGYTHYRYLQQYKGLTVEGAEFIVHVNTEGEIYCANGQLAIGLNNNCMPSISGSDAINKLLGKIDAKEYRWESEFWQNDLRWRTGKKDTSYFPMATLVLYNNANERNWNPGDFKLSYRIDLYVNSPQMAKRYYLDAISGEIVGEVPLEFNCFQTSVNSIFNGNVTIRTAPSPVPFTYLAWDDCQVSNIHIFDWNSSNDIPVPLEVTALNNSWTSMNQRFAGSVLWGTKRAYNYFLARHNRNGYSGNPATSQVTGFINAVFVDANGNFYTDNASMGNGILKVGLGSSGTLTNSWCPLDIMCHEYTHAVVSSAVPNGLTYQGESGALNESFSDIFGEMGEDYTLGSCDYLCGEDRDAGATRSMSNPNAISDPDTYLSATYWATGSGDFGGVHTNSGVQNYFFYLLVNGGSGWNNGDSAHAPAGNGFFYSVTGIGKADARNIMYRALTTYVFSNSQYIDARAATIHAANDLFGNCSNQSIQVANSWYAVGVGAQSPAFNRTICGNLNGNYYGINSIENNCSSVVNSGVTSNMSALTLVKLTPPFIANNGSTFRAYLGEPCALTSYKLHQQGGESDSEANEWSGPVEEMDFMVVIPNPFSEKAKIVFNLANESGVELSVYNLQMQILKRVESNSSLKPGRHEMNLDASDLAAGIYICRLQENDKTHFTRFVVNK